MAYNTVTGRNKRQASDLIKALFALNGQVHALLGITERPTTEIKMTETFLLRSAEK